MTKKSNGSCCERDTSCRFIVPCTLAARPFCHSSYSIFSKTVLSKPAAAHRIPRIGLRRATSATAATTCSLHVTSTAFRVILAPAASASSIVILASPFRDPDREKTVMCRTPCSMNSEVCCGQDRRDHQRVCIRIQDRKWLVALPGVS